MLYLICLGLFLPLVGFLVLFAFADRIKRLLAGLIACSTIFISFLCFITLLVMYMHTDMQAETFTLFSWVPIKGIHADFSLHLDSLSLLMTLIITGIGFLIHVYSNGYMDHEKDFARYFACLNFFVFSMLLLVLAGHLLVLFVGWEGVGLASYLLIGFWYSRPSAAQAATKAFVMNRIGDLGLLLGLLLTFYLFGTGDIAEISQRAGKEFAIGAPIITILTMLYFIGATGKSAQLPLYSWLPDAMEGPTPVSALIHAATMVTAGVYLVVRMHALFMLAPITMQVVGIVGGITALFASLCALGQTDLKRVLAYSTVSQIGLMFLACGAGAFYSAMFHLTTHAFIKALLFLSAGNVVHMLHDTTEMAKMGGLTKIFSKTHWLFLIGVLALAGIPPFAAFFSKDLILEQEYLAGYKTLFYIGLIASILTGVYLTRAYCLTFLGAPRMEEHELKTVKEAPNVMLLPVAILALLSIFGGFLGYTFDRAPLLQNFLREVGVKPVEEELRSGFVLTPETWIAIAGAFLGVILTAWIYTRFAHRLGSPLPLLKNAFYVDEIYEAIIVKPLKAVARTIVQIFEPRIFEGSIRGVARGVQGIAHWMQHLQSGQIRSYIAWMVVGSVLLIVYFVF
jgi:NADH-quinone oxidoreductase subunit L